MSEKSENAALAFERCVNSYDATDIKEVLAHMLNEHPTLQQSFTNRFIIPFVREMGKRFDHDNFDDRNYAACEACSAMWEGLKQHLGADESFYLPMI